MSTPRGQGGRHVTVVVVVAENGEDAMWRFQRRQELGNGLDERPIAERHIVAPENDEVWLLGERKLHGMRHVGGRNGLAVVDVGEKAYTDPVERGRQTGDGQRHLGDSDLMALVRHPVCGDARERADAGSEQSLDGRATTDRQQVPLELHEVDAIEAAQVAVFEATQAGSFASCREPSARTSCGRQPTAAGPATTSWTRPCPQGAVGRYRALSWYPRHLDG